MIAPYIPSDRYYHYLRRREAEPQKLRGRVGAMATLDPFVGSNLDFRLELGPQLETPPAVQLTLDKFAAPGMERTNHGAVRKRRKRVRFNDDFNGSTSRQFDVGTDTGCEFI